MIRMLSLLFFLATLSGFLLWMDLSGYFSMRKKSIASVTFSEGSLRQLRSQEWSWDRIFSGALVANQDLISTSENSSAKIKLFSGGEIVLSPNTTLMISEEKSSLQFKILNETGRLRVSRDLAKKIQPVKSINARVPATSDSKIEVAEGNEVATPAPHSAPIELAVRQDSEIRNIESSLKQAEVENFAKAPPVPELLSPDPAQKWNVDEIKEVAFQWKVSEEDSSLANELRYELILRGVSAKVASRSIVVPTKNLKHVLKNLSPGSYEWSVRSLQGPEKSSVPTFRSFEIAEIAKLREDNFFVYPVEVQ